MLQRMLPVLFVVVLWTAPLAVASHDPAGHWWDLRGNTGTVAGTDFLGTKDNVALHLRVNNATALRLEPAATPRVLGGHGANGAAGHSGATVAGGGDAANPNTVTGAFGFVGGGRGNLASVHGVVAGGFDNDATGTSANIAGGANNDATGIRSTIGGGFINTATGFLATVSGGQDNLAGNDYTVVAGGLDNTANGSASAVSGGRDNAATGHFSLVSGGVDNMASGRHAVVLGGLANGADGESATVAGGSLNKADGDFSFAAGRRASAVHDGAFVWADHSTDADFLSGAANVFVVRAAGGVGINTGTPQEALTVEGHAVPNTDDAWDLGRGDLRWQDLWLSGNVTAGAFIGDGSGLTGVQTTLGPDSVNSTHVQDGTLQPEDLAFTPGDITGVAAGDGLAGGGTSGDVVLSADYAQVQARVTGTCAGGSSINAILQDGNVTCEADDDTTYTGAQPIDVTGSTISLSSEGCDAGESWTWSGTTWECEPAATSGGTVTRVDSGAGLTGGPITTNGTLSIATGGVTSAMIADGNVTTADLANGAVTPAKTSFLKTVATLNTDLGSIAAGAVGCDTRTVSGAATGDRLLATTSSTMDDAFVFHGARISAADTVEVCWRNESAGSVNPTPSTTWVMILA